jgi:penicillin-binding protein 1C
MRLRGAPRRVLRSILAAAGLGALAAAGLVAFELARLPSIPELLRESAPSTVVLDRRGDPLRYELTPCEKLRPWVALAEVHPWLVEATIAVEDARFRSHRGVDLVAAARALWTNLRRGRIVSGASTIPMQTARLLRPLPRGYHSKLREALLALRLEAELGKDRVLELYLNLSPYGGNLHGVEAAARRWLGRAPGDLSLAEAALLAGLPQSPSRYRPDRHPEAARARRDRVLDRMEALGLIGGAQAAGARSREVSVRVEPLPGGAPHFAAWVRERTAPGSRVRTTLDPALQSLAEEAVRSRVEAHGAAGVRNGAAVVVETCSGRIRALVGSQDFLDRRDGQVNGADAPRSPGSLLKTFIYALAFEGGIIGPDTVLHDAPRAWRDGYEPRNFSETFHGPVAAGRALALSLNVPAVEVLERVGVEEAIGRLRALGLGGLRPSAAHYGLSLGLGGVEATLLELVEAYAVLGRLGLHRPLSFREDEEPPPARRVLCAPAAFQATEALEEAGWSAAEREGGLRLPRLALKTGTSFGLRDAWAIAWSPRWTVGVWLGNFDGAPSPALVGASAAAPAARELMRRLHGGAGEGGAGAGDGPEWYARPEDERRGPPPPAELEPAGPRGGRNGGLRWVLPADGAEILAHERPGGAQLTLLAELAGAAPLGPDPLAFFIDGALAGRVRPGETLRAPLRPGAHRITLVAPGGRAETRRVVVRN